VNIVFDLGAVLFTWRPAQLVARWLPQHAIDDVSAAALAHKVFGHADWHAFDQGSLNMDEVVTRTATRLGLDANRLSALCQHIGSELTPMPDTVRVLHQLHLQRQRLPDLRLYYLSNMPVPYARELEASHSFMQWFDGGIFSGDVQHIKPEPAIYQLLQTRYALEPMHTVFIDDLKSNVRAAEEQGWSGIHFESAQQLQSHLAALDLYEISP
jgi:putative hydrolase of the HAD superfamily